MELARQTETLLKRVDEQMAGKPLDMAMLAERTRMAAQLIKLLREAGKLRR